MPANNSIPAKPAKKRLADLPRYLRANGHGTIGAIVVEELAKWSYALDTLTAVLHQMENGEAADFINHESRDHVFADSRKDLLWCREEISTLLKTLS